MKRLIYALSAMMASAGAPSHAVEPVSLVRQSSGYTYFNRSGADLTEHNAALSSCYWGVRASGPSQLYAGNTGIVPDMIVHAMSSQIRMAGQENCMVVSGWRVVRLPDAEGAALAKLSKTDLAEVLAPWVGAVSPPGEIVRVWQNDAARTSTVTRAMPGLSSRETLSNRAMPRVPEPPTTNSQPAQYRPAKMAFFHDAKPEELSAPPLGSSIITMTVRNSAPREWTRVMLRRLSPNSPQEAWRVDGKADVLLFNISPSPKGQAKGTPVSQTLTVVVPPGRWALAMVSDLTDTCHGAPFFDVAPGDVVYAGAIDFGVDGLPIDMNLAPARAKLKDYSSLLAKIRAAKWTNGATFTCGPYGYALEYSDLPYAIGYRRAGK